MISKEMKKIYDAVGPCPYCGKKKVWLNDIPLKAFCSGTEKKPHREWIKTVPKYALQSSVMKG